MNYNPNPGRDWGFLFLWRWHMMRVILIISLIFLVNAAEERKKPEFILKEIVITATRIPEVISQIPENVTVIPEEDIEKEKPKNISEAITNISGINIGKYGSLGSTYSILLRGASSKHTLVLLDGRILNNLLSGEPNLSTILLDNVEKVEIVKGSNASIYGANAVAGIINIITKKKSDKQETNLSLEYGTYNTQIYRINSSYSFNDFNINFGGSYNHSDGHRENSKYDGYNFNGNINYNLTQDMRIIISSGYYYDDKGSPGPISFPSLAKWNEEKKYLHLKLEDTNFNVNLYGNMDRSKYEDPEWPSEFTDTKVKGIGSEGQYTFKLNSHKFTIGYFILQNYLESNKVGSHDANIKSLFSVFEPKIIDNLIFVASLRYDHHSVYGGEINPQLNLGYLLNTTKVYGRVGTSFDAPTMYDLYFPRIESAWGTVEGNPNLKPTKVYSYEIGIENYSEYFFSRIAAFYTEFKDMIEWGCDLYGNWKPQNVKVKNQGIEIELNAIIPPFNFSINYTYLLSKYVDTDKFLMYRPKNQINFIVEYETPFKQLLTLKSQYYDNWVDEYYQWFDSVLLFDLRISQTINKNINLYLSIENLEDKLYQLRKGYPMPRRTITCGTTIKF
jgi:outer membrane cobalamin receptor